MRKIKFLFTMLFMVTALGFTACSDDEEDNNDSFTIINNSGYDFYEIMMSPSSETTWEDILEDDIFPDGSSVKVSFTGSKNGKWDIRLCKNKDDIDNGYVQFKGINLTGRTKLILTKQGDDLWYELE